MEEDSEVLSKERAWALIHGTVTIINLDQNPVSASTRGALLTEKGILRAT